MSDFTVTSPAFREGGAIPKAHAQNGDNRSPPLDVAGLPAGTVSLAVIMDDITREDRPVNGWALWNIPPVAQVPAGVPAEPNVQTLGGAVQSGAYHNHAYHGPKRVRFGGARTYRFTVYALDAVIARPPTALAAEFLETAEGHILARAALTGTYRDGA